MSNTLRKTGASGERKFKKAANLKLNIVKSEVGQNGLITPATPNLNSGSYSALGELLQCGICLERLLNPRMLPCQHTFCLSCLKTHVIAQNLKLRNRSPGTPSDSPSRSPKFTIEPNIKSMSCPICQGSVILDEGVDSVEKLPKNLYLQSLLKVVEDTGVSYVPPENYRCVNCQVISKQQEQVCQHCMQIFCNICWNEHLKELQANLSLLIKQLDESEDRLRCKLDNFQSRCCVLEDKVKKATVNKIEEIRRAEQRVLNDVDGIKKEGAVASDILLDSILKLKTDIKENTKNRNNTQKVNTYMKLHEKTSTLLEQVNYFGEARVTFDPDSFRLEQISEGIYNGEEEQDQQQLQVVSNPWENIETMAKYYKSKSSTPKLLWNKCPRPAGLGIPPWDDAKLLIAAIDSSDVLVVDRNKFKLVAKLSHPDMSCPSGITFCPTRKEVFVSDKWNQCIHVFSKNGEYLRNICGQRLRSPDGIAMSPNGELIICDSANDRVLLVDPHTGERTKAIGAQNGCTQLNFPTSATIFDKKIIIADSGNNRIKIFNLNGDIIQEFGSFGKNPGQFRSPEVVAVDPMGFILVGDAGNARIQIFKPDGTIVKILGSKGGFSWVSGILVTPNLDIIASDAKSRSLRIF